jgi:hypothetical protein
MLRAHRGDRGPRVGLLQVLLNRKGAGLVVDGVFGPKMQAALVAFQESVPLFGTGRADEDTWPELLKDADLEIVDSYDVGDEDYGNASFITEAAGTSTVRTGAMCAGVRVAVQQVIQQVGVARSIGLLRLWGHGNLGRWLTISVGEVVHTTKHDPAQGRAIAAEWMSYIDLAHFDILAPILRAWRPDFAPFGSVEHHGCSLAKVAQTRALVQKLADLWGVPMTVAFRDQWIPYDQASAFRFQGRTFTAFSGSGNLTSWGRAAAVSEVLRP